MLIPSLSSRATWRFLVQEQLELAHALIGFEVLLSAYDLHYSALAPQFDRFSLVVIDSGGYEANPGHDLNEVGGGRGSGSPWSAESYRNILRGLNHTTPTLMVSYDEPGRSIPFRDQLSEAMSLFGEFPRFASTLLLKPEAADGSLIDFAALRDHADMLKNFTVIGVTEKELGTSLFERMMKIAELRLLLQSIGLETPIHIFGALDPMTPPLYMCAGADIFDGLTWLRYGFRDGVAIYPPIYFALRGASAAPEGDSFVDCVTENYLTLGRLGTEMNAFVDSGDFGAFRHHGGLYGTLCEQLRQSMEVGHGR